MKKYNREKRNVWFLSLTLVLSIALLLTACGGGSGANPQQPADAGESGTPSQDEEQVVIKAATAWGQNEIISVGYFMLEEKVKEKSNGRLQLEWIGGPEAIPPFELGEAVRNRVVDFASISAGYNATQVPEVFALGFSNLTPEEERENGALDYLNEIHREKANSIVLGRQPGQGFTFYTSADIQSLEDFKGLRIRVSPIYLAFVQALGAEPVSMPVGEIYNALERKVIDGVAFPELGLAELGVAPLLKNKISPAFFQDDRVFIMNAEAWDNLSQEFKDILLESIWEVEKEHPAVVAEALEKENKTFTDSGVEMVELSDGEEYLKLSREAAWQYMKENNPETGPKLEELFSK